MGDEAIEAVLVLTLATVAGRRGTWPPGFVDGTHWAIGGVVSRHSFDTVRVASSPWMVAVAEIVSVPSEAGSTGTS